jgi:hypothetical protein
MYMYPQRGCKVYFIHCQTLDTSTLRGFHNSLLCNIFCGLNKSVIYLLYYILFYFIFIWGRHSVGGRGGRSGDRIPLGGGGEFLGSLPDGPWDPSSLIYDEYRVFPGVKRPGRGVDHSPPSIAEVEETVELYLFFLSDPSWLGLG